MPEPGDLVATPGDDDRWAALAGLHRDHYRHLVRLAALLVDRPDLAEEIVQEAFLRLHRTIDGVDPATRPAYLRSIVMNLARSGLRRRRLARRVADAQRASMHVVDDGAVGARDDRNVVVAALRRIPRRQRECLVLRFYEDAAVAEIAEALGISEGAVKAHLHRGRRAMAELLKDAR